MDIVTVLSVGILIAVAVSAVVLYRASKHLKTKNFIPNPINKVLK